MRRLVAVSVVVAVFMFLTATAPMALAAYTWSTFGDNQYTLTQTTDTFQQCENEAVSAGGHLVTINSLAENDWLVSKFPMKVWTGLYGNVGDWAWKSGEPVVFTSWDVANGQPDGYPSPEAAIFGWYTSGKWHDIPVSGYGTYQGIIEESVPEPSTLILLGMSAVSLFFVWRRRKQEL